MALQDRTGQKVPSVVFRTRVGDTWKDVSTDDLFKGKKVSCFLCLAHLLQLALLLTCHATTNCLVRSKKTVLTQSTAYL